MILVRMEVKETAKFCKLHHHVKAACVYSKPLSASSHAYRLLKSLLGCHKNVKNTQNVSSSEKYVGM